MVNIRPLIYAGAAFAVVELMVIAPLPASARSADDRETDLTAIEQEIQGYPNPDGNWRCTLVSEPVFDHHDHFVGYHAFNACEANYAQTR